MGEGVIRDPGDYEGRHRPGPGRWDAALIRYPQRYVLGFDGSRETGTVVRYDTWRGYVEVVRVRDDAPPI